jgi:hypothetical protein
MRPFLITTFVTLISCQTHPKQNIDLGANGKASNKTELPQFVQIYLAKELPGWKLAPKNAGTIRLLKNINRLFSNKLRSS